VVQLVVVAEDVRQHRLGVLPGGGLRGIDPRITRGQRAGDLPPAPGPGGVQAMEPGALLLARFLEGPDELHRFTDGKPFARLSDRGDILLPGGARGPAFLTLQNFRVIMKYNPAEAYALAIGHLADRLAGGGAFVQSWPRDEHVLTIAERYELQQLLARRGFDIGAPDGLLGPRTRLAVRNFQAANGQIPDGFASSHVLDRLRQP